MFLLKPVVLIRDVNLPADYSLNRSVLCTLCLTRMCAYVQRDGCPVENYEEQKLRKT